jgi:hypothetical protein
MTTVPKLPEAPVSGQMLALERQKLFEWVYTSEPALVIETGGGSEGGGSTFCIAEALRKLKEEGKCKKSIFCTCDVNNYASRNFYLSHPDYKEFMEFFTGTSENFISQLLAKNLVPDFIFFDGPEDPTINIRDFLELDCVVESGCKFAMHDWETVPRIFDGGLSIKAEKVRPYLENLETWTIEEQLSGLEGQWPNENEPQSVGLVYSRKL